MTIIYCVFPGQFPIDPSRVCLTTLCENRTACTDWLPQVIAQFIRDMSAFLASNPYSMSDGCQQPLRWCGLACLSQSTTTNSRWNSGTTQAQNSILHKNLVTWFSWPIKLRKWLDSPLLSICKTIQRGQWVKWNTLEMPSVNRNLCACFFFWGRNSRSEVRN